MSNTAIIRVSSDKYTTKVGEQISILIPASLLNKPAVSIRILDAIIPFTWTNIPSNQNTFALTDIAGTNNVIIPNHTFTPTNLIVILKELCDAASGAGLIFTVLYHKCAGIVEFQADGPFTLNFSVANNAAALLGFNPATYTATETTPTSGIWFVQGNRRGQLDIDKYVNITSDLVNGLDQGVLLFDGQPNPTNSNIVATIPIRGTSGDNIIFTETVDAPDIDIRSSVLGQIVNPNTDASRTITFGLSLDSGIPVNLNGAYWAARFLLKFSY